MPNRKRSMFTLSTVLLVAALLTLSCQGSFKIVSAHDWGATPPPFTLPQHKIQHITIHHGGVEFSKDKDPVAYIKHLQDWSRKEKGWMDIPYHFLIDLDGNIYEGRDIRYPGDTNTNYDPTGHALVCVLGNFETQSPTQKQLRSLAWLCAELSKQYHVPLKNIKSHKDYTETLCPGKNLYKHLQDGSLLNMIQEFQGKR
ncbi:peptidoglycan recognition protein family protein [Caldithrix abyssi]